MELIVLNSIIIGEIKYLVDEPSNFVDEDLFSIGKVSMILNFKSSLMKLLYIQNNNKRESSFQCKFQVNEHVWEYVQHRKSGYVWDAIILQYGRDGLIRPCFCSMDTIAPVGFGLFCMSFGLTISSHLPLLYLLAWLWT